MGRLPWGARLRRARWLCAGAACFVTSAPSSWDTVHRECIVNMTQYCQTGTAMTVEQYSILEGSFLLQFVSISQPLASSCLSSAGVGCPTILWRRSSQPPWPASASTGSDNQGTHHMLPKMRYYDFLTVDVCGIRFKTVSKWGQDVHHPTRSD